ncbi:MAG: dihydroorotase [Actinomycetota bacterium]
MKTVLLQGGTLITAAGVIEADLRVSNGIIAEIGKSLAPATGELVIDVSGQWVGPGFVDLHTHLREPGDEAAETISSGARAGIVGGFTALLGMPNTQPALDNVALVSFVLAEGKRTPITIAVAGAITQGRQGEQLAPMAEMAGLGVQIFTDDGSGVQSAGVMRRALSYAKPLGVRLAQHCEDATLAGAGVMNEGALAESLGLQGRSGISEEIMVQRDIDLVRSTGSRMHFLHLSTARSIDLVVAAKVEGLDITCEVTPHHLTLDESTCATYDPIFKVHPPLRSSHDVLALREALRRGLIDAVATDHAPHAPESKDRAFDEAPAGMLGLETAASLTFEALGQEKCDPELFFSVLSRGPARIAKLQKNNELHGLSAQGGELLVGEEANLTVFNPMATWTVDASALQSRASNTPFVGRVMTGRVSAVIAKGTLVLHEGKLQ